MNDLYQLISKGGLSLERLITLCRVVDAGGLTKAAGGDVSRLSLYSRQLKDLESFLRVSLTRKVGRTVIPTDTARDLAAATRGQLKTLQSFMGAEAPEATFVLGASHSLLEWLIVPRLPAIRKVLGDRRPIRLHAMRSREIGEALEDRRLDLGLVRADAVPRGLAKQPLFRMGYALYVRKDLAGDKSAREILCTQPLALSMGGQLVQQFEEFARRDRLKLRIEIEATSFSLTAAAVQTGACAAILPDIVNAVAMDPRVVRMTLPTKFRLARSIAASWHQGASDAGLTTLVNFLGRI